MPPATHDALSAPPPDASLRRYRSGLAFGFFNAINWQVALGTPMVLLIASLGGSTFASGLAYSFVLLLVPLQVLATPLLARWGYKRTVLSGWGLRSIFCLPPIFLAYWAREHGAAPWMVWVMLGSVFCFTVLRSMASGAWMPWLYSILPEGVRGRYFASDQVFSGVASVGVLAFCAALSSHLGRWDSFMFQYGLSFLGAVCSVLALRGMPDGPRPQMIGLGHTLREAPQALVRPGVFRSFLIVSCWQAAAVNGIPAFAAYFLQNQMGVSVQEILVLETLRYAGAILGSLALRDQIDQTGPRPYLFLSLGLFMAVAGFWFSFLALGWSGTAYLKLFYFMAGMATSTWISAQLSYLPAVLPDKDHTLLLAVYGAAASLAGGLSTLAWGYGLKQVDPLTGTQGVDHAAFMAFFAFVLVSLVGLVIWVRRLPFRPTRAPALELGSLVLRPQRAISALVCLVDAKLAPGPANGNGRGAGPRA